MQFAPLLRRSRLAASTPVRCAAWWTSGRSSRFCRALMAPWVLPGAALGYGVVGVAITLGRVVPWVPAAQVAVQAPRRAARVVSGSVPRIAAGKHWYHYRFWRY